MNFMQDIDWRPVHIKNAGPFQPVGLALGKGTQGLEILLVAADHRPSAADLRTVWRTRLAGRATPLVVVAIHDGKASFCGPAGDPPPAHVELEASRVERICRTALEEPDRHAALRFVLSAIDGLESRLAGLRNEGLFSTHELEVGVPEMPCWKKAMEKAGSLLAKRDGNLLSGLGFTVEHLPGPASILRAAKSKVAVAVLLEREEVPEVSNPRFSKMSPVSYALSKADEENLHFVMLLSGPKIRLYPTQNGVGIGRRGRTETYIEIHLDLLEENKAGYLPMIFSAEALQSGGTFEKILSRSADFAADLGKRLRERIHGQIVPPLAEALVGAQTKKKLSVADTDQAYQMALTILFRLLFIAYAEDRDLLPYRTNELYRSRSLKQKARELLKIRDANAGYGDGDTHWQDVFQLFRAVDMGEPKWDIPLYNGGLFSADPSVSPIGAALEKVKLTDRAFGPILANLIIDQTPDDTCGPVDFRSLGVREFGTIYEGLLENELSIAETDLTVDSKGGYMPVRKKADKVVVQAGRAYLHNASGARKATGSFFTKHFAVEHLLDHALEPALQEHLERLDMIKDDRKAADAFFDFRVADIAMGSGHFLVAAVDRVERRLSGYLSRRPLPDVTTELQRLRASARKALGILSDRVEIEDSQLIRRQIARRCIYGVDINGLSAELARLSLWIHTFVPGLPLSFLNHNLRQGNSLIGIATVDEAGEFIGLSGGSLFAFSAEEHLLGPAKIAIARLAMLADADKAEIEAARRAVEEAEKAIAPAEAIFDIICAARVDEEFEKKIKDIGTRDILDFAGSPEHLRAMDILSDNIPMHFPIAFPEVFLRERAGFDVILGNPPWEKTQVEEHGFWCRYEPGLRGLTQAEREKAYKKLNTDRPDLVLTLKKEKGQAEILRRVLLNGPFPGMKESHPDLYKAFTWRFFDLASPKGGRFGVVLPRAAFSAMGSKDFRFAILEKAVVEDLTTLTNRGGWVFDDVHPQYSITLASVRKEAPPDNPVLSMRGPYNSFLRYQEGIKKTANQFFVKDVISWTDTASLPLLPDDASAEIFTQLRTAPRLDANDGSGWAVRPLQGDLNATTGKPLMSFGKQPKDAWPVLKGESFDIWDPDTGSYYAWADPKKVIPILEEKRKRSRTSYSSFSEEWIKDSRTLPCLKPRLAFRDVSRATDSRTFRVALLPPEVFVVHTSPFFLWPKGDEKDQAFLLGVLSSIPLDWYARRFVETHLTFFTINPFPVPRPPRSSKFWTRAVALAGRLACPDRRFAKWAKAVGVEYGKLNADEKDDMIHELDAIVAHLYGLSEKQLTHVYETFHEGWDYTGRLAGVIKHFRRWEGRK